MRSFVFPLFLTGILLLHLFVLDAFAQTGPNPIEQQFGLQLAVIDRFGFGEFLMKLPPVYARTNRVDDSILLKMRQIAFERKQTLQDDMSSQQKEWEGSEAEERQEMIGKLLKRDDKLVIELLTDLEELLQPNQLNGLFVEYLRTTDTSRLRDPIVSKWIGLTGIEVSQMKDHSNRALDFLRKARKAQQPSERFQGLPGKMDREFRVLREKHWSALPSRKLVKCFQVMGLLGPTEGLKDYLKQNPERGEYLVEAVPAFSIAQHELDKESTNP